MRNVIPVGVKKSPSVVSLSKNLRYIRRRLQELIIPSNSNYTMNLNNIFLFIVSVAKGDTLSFPFSFLCILYLVFSFSVISFLYMFMYF